MSSLIRRSRIPIAKEGIPFISLAAFFTLVFAILHWVTLTLCFLVVTFLTVNFFRDPERITPTGPGLVVSPADGKIVEVERVREDIFLRCETIKISIFMSIFNVHVNRIPYSGKVNTVKHWPGKFLSANKRNASFENERNAVLLDMEGERQLVVVQVAGLIARRIVCWARPGDYVTRGERYGMIRFGSRLDVYVPLNSNIKVKRGDKVRAGESVLCQLV